MWSHRAASLPVLALLAHTAAAQGATVGGTVRDTLARAPLPSAWVQLASRENVPHFARTVQADALVRYEITDVPAGRYGLWFFHPRLDSLGVTAPVRDLQVGGQRVVRADLSTPSAAMLRAAICPERSARQASGALFIGLVRAARDGAPLEGATITSEWVEFTIGARAVMERRQPRVDATSGENGLFAICDVPDAGSIFVRASLGADSTDLVELLPASQGFMRRDLFLGGSGGAPVFLRGTIIAADSSRPLVNALVRIGGGATRANARGEWVLAVAPGGTRVLEVRAIGYYPKRVPVDVVADAPPSLIEMVTFQAMLDTVRVVAARLTDRSEGEFERRRRTRDGHFLTEAQIERLGRSVTSELFRMVPGTSIEGLAPERTFSVRSAVGDRCKPAIYIDGLYMFDLTPDELDGILTPARIRAIEIYVGARTPMEFQQALSGCGAIVIWTKGAPPRAP